MLRHCRFGGDECGVHQETALHVTDAIANMQAHRQFAGSALRGALDDRVAQRREDVAVGRIAQGFFKAAHGFFFEGFEFVLFEQGPHMAVLAAFPRQPAHHAARRRRRRPACRKGR